MAIEHYWSVIGHRRLVPVLCTCTQLGIHTQRHGRRKSEREKGYLSNFKLPHPQLLTQLLYLSIGTMSRSTSIQTTHPRSFSTARAEVHRPVLSTVRGRSAFLWLAPASPFFLRVVFGNPTSSSLDIPLESLSSCVDLPFGSLSSCDQENPPVSIVCGVEILPRVQ